METLLFLVQTINKYLSDYILIVLLVGTGLLFSIKTRFVQVRCFGEGLRSVFGGFKLHGGKQHGASGQTEHAGEKQADVPSVLFGGENVTDDEVGTHEGIHLLSTLLFKRTVQNLSPSFR